jgi:hypothetical protein
MKSGETPLTSQSVLALAQVPATQTSPLAHACPHAPQLAGSADSGTHALPQRDHPGWHSMWHVPLSHEAKPLCGAAQELPQAPQLPVSFVRSAQELPHAARPGAHAVDPEQLPPTHEVPHATLQPPQSVDDVFESTQRLPHVCSGGAQAPTQPVGEQREAAPVHEVLHEVHVAGCERSASQPSDGSPLQSAQPALHEATAHAPDAEHVARPLATVQGSQELAEHPNAGSDVSTH